MGREIKCSVEQGDRRPPSLRAVMRLSPSIRREVETARGGLFNPAKPNAQALCGRAFVCLSLR